MRSKGRREVEKVTGSRPWLVTHLALLALASACTVGAASQSPPGAPTEAKVMVELFQFQPGRLTAHVGTRVIWVNRDDVIHTVTSVRPGLFHGILDGKDRTFSVTFDRTGTYPYFCNRHEHMRGEVVIQP